MKGRHKSSPRKMTGRHESSPGKMKGRHESSPGKMKGRHESSPGKMKGRHESSPVKSLARIISAALLVAAIGKELSKPASERTWTGTVASFVPYDFRRPTFARAQERLWAPDNPHLMTPQVFGVGWTVNFGRVMSLLRARSASAGEAGTV
jgi:hypothetical protein